MVYVNKHVLTLILFFLSAQSALAQEKLKAEELLQHHLDSLGSATVRSTIKSRVIEGTARFTIIGGGAGTIDGKMVMVSEDRKFQLMMKFLNSDYSGEKFVTDGHKVQVAFTAQNSRRSRLGEFVYVQDGVMREGLLGGVLSTAWPLFDLEHRKPKLSYEGLKSIDGEQLCDVRYIPEKKQDVDIHLYFDPQSFHHVRTVYTMSIDPQLARGGSYNDLAIPELGGSIGIQGKTSNEEMQARRQQVTRYRIDERFSEFKTADGMTLPNRYRIQYTQDQQGGTTVVWQWDTSTQRILENVSLDARNFEMK